MKFSHCEECRSQLPHVGGCQNESCGQFDRSTAYFEYVFCREMDHSHASLVSEVLRGRCDGVCEWPRQDCEAP